MGITGLWPTVKDQVPHSRVEVHDPTTTFKGKTFAIDIPIVAHKFLMGNGDSDMSPGETAAELSTRMCEMFEFLVREAGVTPIAVFDGKPRTAKSKYEHERRKKKSLEQRAKLETAEMDLAKLEAEAEQALQAANEHVKKLLAREPAHMSDADLGFSVDVFETEPFEPPTVQSNQPVAQQTGDGTSEQPVALDAAEGFVTSWQSGQMVHRRSIIREDTGVVYADDADIEMGMNTAKDSADDGAGVNGVGAESKTETELLAELLAERTAATAAQPHVTDVLHSYTDMSPVTPFSTQAEMEAALKDPAAARRYLRALTNTYAMRIREAQAKVRNLVRSMQRPTKEQLADVFFTLKAEGYDVFVALHDAEEACAYLTQCGLADYVLTDDGDSLTFGARKVLCNWCGGNAPPYTVDLGTLLKGLKLNHQQFIDVCMMAGCDFAEPLAGVGMLTGLRLIRRYGSLERILQAMNKARAEFPSLLANWQGPKSKRPKRPFIMYVDEKKQTEKRLYLAPEEAFQKFTESVQDARDVFEQVSRRYQEALPSSWFAGTRVHATAF